MSPFELDELSSDILVFLAQTSCSHLQHVDHRREWQCVNMNSSGSHGVIMRTKCPEANVDPLCETMDSTDFLRGMPVVDEQEGVIYRNVFCARCNYATSVSYWRMAADCGRIPASALPRDNALLIAFIRENCSIQYTPTTQQQPHIKRCVAAEGNCSSKERVDKEPVLDELCSFYAFPVCGTSHKNPHCGLCSGDDITQYDCGCQALTLPTTITSIPMSKSTSKPPISQRNPTTRQKSSTHPRTTSGYTQTTGTTTHPPQRPSTPETLPGTTPGHPPATPWTEAATTPRQPPTAKVTTVTPPGHHTSPHSPGRPTTHGFTSPGHPTTPAWRPKTTYFPSRLPTATNVIATSNYKETTATVFPPTQPHEPPPPLNILFDFSSGSNQISIQGKTTIIKQKTCNEGFVYDPFVDMCREAFHKVLLATNSSLNSTNSTMDSIMLNCSFFIRLNSSKTTLYPNGTLWVPLYKTEYNQTEYFVNGSYVFVCTDFTSNYSRRDTMWSYVISPLQILTYVGCSVSVLSLLILVVIYGIFKELRTLPGKNLINLSLAMIFYHIFLFGAGSRANQALCTMIAILLQYFLLSSFAWMSVMAFDVAKTFAFRGKLCN